MVAKRNVSGLMTPNPFSVRQSEFDLMPRNPNSVLENLRTAGGSWNVASRFMNNVDVDNRPQARVYQKGNFTDKKSQLP